MRDATSILSELNFKAVWNAAQVRPELFMNPAAKPMERDLKQERHAQNGPPTSGSKTQQNDSQAQFSSIAEVLEDVLTGIGASTDDAGGPVRITGNDPVRRFTAPARRRRDSSGRCTCGDNRSTMA
jgi:hypothetical protein